MRYMKPAERVAVIFLSSTPILLIVSKSPLWHDSCGRDHVSSFTTGITRTLFLLSHVYLTS